MALDEACAFTFTFTLGALLLAREHPVEGLVHDGRTAHPESADAVGTTQLADLRLDEVLVPALRVHFLLRQPRVQPEVVDVLAAAKGVGSLEELESD